MLKIDNNIIKVIVTDVDGTILPMEKSGLSKKTIDVIKRLTNEGIYFVLNTGNMPLNIKWLVEQINPTINNTTRYFIGNSGVVLYDFLTDELIIEDHFNKEAVAQIVHYLKNKKIDFSITSMDMKTVWISKQSEVERLRLYSSNKNIEINYTLFEDSILGQIESPKIMFTCNGPEDEYNEVILELNKILGAENYAAMSWVKGTADLITPCHDKYTGLISLVNKINKEQHEEITLDNVLYFGDNYNDLPVFEKHKYSIAVDNAIDDIKKLAYAITSSATNDGVAKYLEKIEIKK